MHKQKIVIVGVLFLAVTALATLASYFRNLPSEPNDDSKGGSRLPQLKELVEQ